MKLQILINSILTEILKKNGKLWKILSLAKNENWPFFVWFCDRKIIIEFSQVTKKKLNFNHVSNSNFFLIIIFFDLLKFFLWKNTSDSFHGWNQTLEHLCVGSSLSRISFHFSLPTRNIIHLIVHCWLMRFTLILVDSIFFLFFGGEMWKFFVRETLIEIFSDVKTWKMTITFDEQNFSYQIF